MPLSPAAERKVRAGREGKGERVQKECEGGGEVGGRGVWLGGRERWGRKAKGGRGREGR